MPPPKAAKAFEAQSTWAGFAVGTLSALAVSVPNVQSMSDLIGVPVRFNPAGYNPAGPATISINGMTAIALKRPSSIGLVALSGGEVQNSAIMTVMYNGFTVEIMSPLDMTAIGTDAIFRGATAPRGSLVEDGSCVSRTTYAALFVVIGTNYSACDGTTTFGLPTAAGHAIKY